jgi:hypothetical protein
MAGEGLNSKFAYNRSRKVAQQVMNKDINEYIKGIVGIKSNRSFFFLATKYISRRLIQIAAVILEDAVKKCPYESGELRESGVVRLTAGAVTGMDIFVKVEEGTGNTDSPTVVIIKDYISKGAAVMEMSISFDKQVKGRDLALWAHEELLRYVRRPKTDTNVGTWHATHYGTGPKYLENAFKLHRSAIPSEIRRGLVEAIKAYNKRHKTRARRRAI